LAATNTSTIPVADIPTSSTATTPTTSTTATSTTTAYISGFTVSAIGGVAAVGPITVAGLAGVEGAGDGAGTLARFKNPVGIAVDIFGTIFVADQGNSTIRKINPNGTVITFAGVSGIVGSSDGIGASARFSYPAGIAVDTAGVVYVADRNDSTIRQITPAGLVSTLAGSSGTNGFANGASAQALFSFPTALAVDARGIVYVADTDANTIRLIRSAVPQFPTLSMSFVAGQIILSWPASDANYVLETRSDLSPSGSWKAVVSEPAVVGCSFVVTNDLQNPAAFFRLHSW
jgi:hypothetical protein